MLVIAFTLGDYFILYNLFNLSKRTFMIEIRLRIVCDVIDR